MAEPLRYRRPQSDVPPQGSSRQRLVTPSLADELGERQYTVDAASDTLLETLRFRGEFGGRPSFEQALRAQVESARALRHAALATAVAVNRDETALSLVSRLPSGRRLSELPPADSGWTSALKAVRELLPALLVLHEDGIAHGALSTRRVIMTRDGRLVLVEHVLATAIESLNLSPDELRAIGIAVHDSAAPVRFTERTDLAQMGFLALSLLVGRTLPATDFPARVPDLLDEFVGGVGMPGAAAKVRTWLERAMDVNGAQPFVSSQEADAAFDTLSHDVSVRVAESAGALLAFESEGGAAEETHREPAPAPVHAAKPAIIPAVINETRAATASKTAARSEDAPAANVPPRKKPRKAVETETRDAVAAVPAARTGRALGWVIAIMAVLAIAEGAVLLNMLYAQSASSSQSQGSDAAVADASPSASVPSTTPKVTSSPRSSAKTNPAASAARPANTPALGPRATPAAKSTVPPAQRLALTPAPRLTVAPAAPPALTGSAAAFGGLTVTSPIELQVFKDGVLVGSTAAPIAVAGGRYPLEFVNTALGFRVTLPATITGGQMTTLNVAVPNGRVSINAVPWAEVTIDGRSVGQTPLANLSIPIGTHDVVFRHPQFGEKRQTVTVTLDGIARVTQNYR